MTPLQFAGTIAIPFLIAHYLIIKKEGSKLKTLLWIVIALKLFMTLTMGHFDLFRFITFLQNFVANPEQNPWTYDSQTFFATFPYPPVLMYIHAFFFWLFEPFLNLSHPYWPTPYAYTIISIPILIIDLLFLRLFLKARNKSTKKTAFLFYLINPLLLYINHFHGQFDWIAIFPFFLAILEYEKNKLSNKFLIYLTISLILKPFALLLLPVIFVDLLPDIKKHYKEFFKYLALILIPIIIWKLSELPYSLSPEYRATIGAKAFERIFSSNRLIPIPLFPTAYIAMGIYWLVNVFKRNNWKASERIIVIMLLLSAFRHPTPNWLIWLFPFVVILHLRSNKQLSAMWWIWIMVTLLQITVQTHNAFFDSAGILTTYFLKLDKIFMSGAPYIFLETSLGESIVKNLRTLIGLANVIIPLTIIFAILKPKIPKTSLLKISKKLLGISLLIFIISGCAQTTKCEYDKTLVIHEKSYNHENQYSIKCCIKNPDYPVPLCIPENRDIVIPIPYQPFFDHEKATYTLIEPKKEKQKHDL